LRTTITEFLRDVRGEVVISVIFSIMYIAIFICKYFDLLEVPIDIFLESYLTPDRLNGVASFFCNYHRGLYRCHNNSCNVRN